MSLLTVSSVFRNPAPVEDEDSRSINSDPEAKVRAHEFVLHILPLFKENNCTTVQGTYFNPEDRIQLNTHQAL